MASQILLFTRLRIDMKTFLKLSQVKHFAKAGRREN